MRSVSRQGTAVDPRASGQASRRQARDRHRHHAHEGGRGQDDDERGVDAGARQDRQEGRALPARAVDGAGVRRQGRRHRWRLFADRADGGHQPPLQRRLPRSDRGAQSARGRARRVDLQRQSASDRSVLVDLAAHGGHERPRAALLGRRPGRQGARRAARASVRHHRRVRSHGGVRARRAASPICAAASAASSWRRPSTASR